MDQLASLYYPKKIYLVGVLCIVTVISLVNIYSIENASGDRPYLFIFWDTFLAWVSVWIAILLDLVFCYSRKIVRTILLICTGAMWLLFFPNTPYLITELLHVFVRYSFDPLERFWMDVTFWQHLFSLFMITILGLLLGTYSLYSVQNLVRKSFGEITGWFFIIIVLLLSSFGIYIGRFVRWNSWDIFMHPDHIVGEMVSMLTDADKALQIYTFCKFIFLVLIMSYIPIYILARTKRV